MNRNDFVERVRRRLSPNLFIPYGIKGRYEDRWSVEGSIARGKYRKVVVGSGNVSKERLDTEG